MGRLRQIDEVTLRRLRRRDLSALRGHLLRLDREARRLRFAGAMSDSALERYAARSLGAGRVLWGAFLGGELRAIAELCIPAGPRGAPAEVALSVERQWQNLGIGDALFGRLLLAARNRGVARVDLVCLSENDPMLHLAVKHHALLKIEREMVEARIALPGPSPLSLLQEHLPDLGAPLQRLARQLRGLRPQGALRGLWSGPQPGR